MTQQEPVGIAVLILTTGSLGVLTFPLVGLLLMRLADAWGDRPWKP